jgi:hypothetical protein
MKGPTNFHPDQSGLGLCGFRVARATGWDCDIVVIR